MGAGDEHGRATDGPHDERFGAGADHVDPAPPTDRVAGVAGEGEVDDVVDLDTLEHALSDDLAEVAHAADIAEADVVAIAAERDQFKDLALRLQADFENYRKRAAAQVSDEVDRATGRLAEALLPVLDAAEAAYLRHPDEVGPLLNAMLTELKKHGLEALDLEGQTFDPNLAEAVAHDGGGGGEVLVAEVLRSGYRWKGRTLRPAMVRTRE